MYKIHFKQKGIGEIRIGNYKELFQSDLSYWSIKQYKDQWYGAMSRIVDGKPACFITSITEPKYANYIRTWICYPKEKKLVFQEKIHFIKESDEPFDVYNPHKYIEPYSALTKEGVKVSEWWTNR